MGVWFPDNLNRRDRAQQLSNDITMMQNNILEAKASMDRSNARMVPYINEVLHNHGMSTFDDLRVRLDATLAPEQREAYEALVEASQGITEGNDKTLTILSIIVLCCETLAQDGTQFTGFLVCGHITSIFRAYAKAFVILITEGVEAGRTAFQAIRKSAKFAADFLKDESKFVNCAAWASKMLEIIAVCGVAAEVYVLAASAYDEWKQRCFLRSAINDLFVGRIVSKVYSEMCRAIQVQDGLITAYLLMMRQTNLSPATRAAADGIVNEFMRSVTADWEEINTTSCYTLLSNLDNGRASWVCEDPSQSSAIEQADTLAQNPEICNKGIQDEKQDGASSSLPLLPSVFEDTLSMVPSDSPDARGNGEMVGLRGALRARFDVMWNFR